MVVSVLVVAAAVGILVGGVGVGGVLLAPALVTMGVLDTHVAIATSSWVFLFTGVVGTWRYSRTGDVPWHMVARLALGVVPAALVGVWANRRLPGEVVLLIVAVIAVFAGINVLRASSTGCRPQPRPGTTVGIGAIVGFGSALTGTGGPVLLVPLLLMMGTAPLVAIAASQAIQLPVVAVSSAGYLAAGSVQVGLGTLLGLVAALGVLGGTAAARIAGVARLRIAAGIACCAAGLLLLLRVTLSGSS